jgi:hypothetical protein
MIIVETLTSSQEMTRHSLPEGSIARQSFHDKERRLAEIKRKNVTQQVIATWNYKKFDKFLEKNDQEILKFIQWNPYILALTSEQRTIELINIDSPVLFGLIVDHLKKIKEKHTGQSELPEFDSFLDYVFLKSFDHYLVTPKCQDWKYHVELFNAMIPKLTITSGKVKFSSSVRKIIDEIESIKLCGL